MAVALPHIASENDYRAIFARDAVWLPAIRAICERHGLSSDLHRAVLGSHVVFQCGERIVKLFCPLWQEDERAERLVLQRVKGLPFPELVAAGTIDGWPYLVMTAVPGTPALDVWHELDERQHTHIVRELGEIMRRLHGHPPIPELAVDWDTFLAARIAACPEHHEVEGPWRDWIAARVDGFGEPPFDPSLINADITEDHLLLIERNGRWTISGLIDFGDAMMGHPYYDFIAPLAFYTYGEPTLSRALVEAYGIELTPEVRERMTTYCLLHKYGRLADFLKRHPVSDGNEFDQAMWGDG